MIPAKKKTLGIALLLIAALALLLAKGGRKGPSYQGRPIAAWLQDWAVHKGTDAKPALRQVGTNSLSYVIASLKLNESRPHLLYGRLYPKIPQALHRFFPEPIAALQVNDGAHILLLLAPDSIPATLALVDDRSPTVRAAAAEAIFMMRSESKIGSQAIPALVKAADDDNPRVVAHALKGLSTMGPAASNAVPVLRRVLIRWSGASLLHSITNMTPPLQGLEAYHVYHLRSAAAVVLGKIGPAAASALPELNAALLDPDSHLRGAAAVGIWRITGETQTALPVIIQELPNAAQDELTLLCWALIEMGPRAKPAIPQLRKISALEPRRLRGESFSELRARDVLMNMKIDP